MEGCKDEPEAYREIFKDFLVKNKELTLEAFKDPRLTCQQARGTKLSNLKSNKTVKYFLNLVKISKAIKTESFFVLS